MNTLAVVTLLAAVAYASASGIALGHGIGVVSARGAVEGALGGQWIPDVPNVASGATAKGVLEGALGGQWVPDVPVAAHGAAIVAPGVGLGLAGHGIGLGLAAPGIGLAGPGIGLAAPGLGLGLGLGHGVASRGVIEGALGGQWIPDTHGK